METSFTRLPWPGRISAFLVLGGAITGGFHQYYEKPARAEMSSREAQLASLRASVAKSLATARTLPEFRAQVDDLESLLSSLREVLPGEKDAGDLLRRLQTAAAQSNLQIKSFKPSTGTAKALYTEWPISLELTGTYHNLASFFERVSRFTRIVNITGVDIQHNSKPGPNATLSVTCVATTFVLLDGPAQPASGARPTSTAWEAAALFAQGSGAPETYTYDPSGRRDPFVSPLGADSPPHTPSPPGEGTAGLAIAEISIRGVMRSRGGFVALVRGPDGKTFLVRKGDAFADGSVKTVNAEGLVVVQDVNDPRSLVAEREVIKKLRSLEAKP